MTPLDTTLEIDTPEHLAFRARVAGPTRRALAWGVDVLIQGVLFLAYVIMMEVLFHSAGLGEASGLPVLLGIFFLTWFYFTAAEILTGGRSPGKIAFRLRVVQPNGLPVTWQASVLRNFLRCADLIVSGELFVLLGPLIMGLDSKFRRLGDMVAGTIVVVEDQTRVRANPSLPADPEIVERLPRTLPLDRDDLAALELFVNRDPMGEARRRELAEIVAPIYARRLGITHSEDPTRFLASLWAKAQDPRRRIDT